MNLEHLEARENPSFAVPEAFPDFMPGFPTSSLVFAGGDFDGNGTADWAATPAEGSGGSIRLTVRSGGIPGTPLVYPGGPGSPGVDPSFGLVIKDVVLNDPSFRGGAVIAGIRSPDGSHSIVAVSPGVGGGPIVNLVDLADGTIKTQLVLDINYRGGLRFTPLPPLSGVGYPDSLILATPAPGGGGGPVATIFDGNGEFLRSFYVGPVDDRSGNYQPYPAGAGVSAPDGSGKQGVFFAAPGVAPFFLDYDGVFHPDLNTGGGAAA